MSRLRLTFLINKNMKCKKCNTENIKNAKYCRHCGFKLQKKKNKRILISIISLFLLIGVSYSTWYFLQPYNTIYPSVSKVNFGTEGGEKTIKISTSAEYKDWHVSNIPSWLDITRTPNSIIIECEKNEQNQNGFRTANLHLYCNGRNNDYITIKVIQEESDLFVQGEIKDVGIEHHSFTYNDSISPDDGMKIVVTCNVRHNNGNKIKCCVWFYKNGEKIISDSYDYSTRDKQLTVQDEFYPTDNVNEKFALYIPYSVFPSNEDLTLTVGLLEYKDSSNGHEFASKRDIPFTIDIDDITK